MQKRKVIAIHGKAGAGKSTLANNISDYFRSLQNGDEWMVTHISDGLKKIVIEFGFKDLQYESDFSKSTYSPILKMTYGYALQVVGEKMCEMFGKDVHIKRWAHETRFLEYRIIDDLRKPEELLYLKEHANCYFIKIEDSPDNTTLRDTGRDPHHYTEAGLPDNHFDMVLPYHAKGFNIDLITGWIYSDNETASLLKHKVFPVLA